MSIFLKLKNCIFHTECYRILWLFSITYWQSAIKFMETWSTLALGTMLVRVFFIFSFTQLHGLQSIICVLVAFCTLHSVLCISGESGSFVRKAHTRVGVARGRCTSWLKSHFKFSLPRLFPQLKFLTPAGISWPQQHVLNVLKSPFSVSCALFRYSATFLQSPPGVLWGIPLRAGTNDFSSPPPLPPPSPPLPSSLHPSPLSSPPLGYLLQNQEEISQGNKIRTLLTRSWIWINKWNNTIIIRSLKRRG